MSFWDRFLINSAARFLWLYTSFVGKTSRVIWLGREHEERLFQSGVNAIYSYWHGRQAMLMYLHRNKPIVALASASKDGELAAQVGENFGLSTVRGSSRKKSTEGLRALIRCARQGYFLGMSPDGPIGPACQVKQGILYMSQLLEMPILPLSVAYSKKVVFKSWDSFMMPLPLGRIVISYGEPIWIKKEDDLGAKAIEVKAILDSLGAEADRVIQ